jgi:hypothetical protein
MAENLKQATVAAKAESKGLSPEEIWIRAFVEFYGTDNTTRCCEDDLNGVSLTRVVEALMLGSLAETVHLQRGGCICTISHQSDDDLVEVSVFFDADVMKLEIKKANRMEQYREPNAA